MAARLRGPFQGGGLRIKRYRHSDCRGTANQDEHHNGQNEQLPHHTPRVKGQEQSPTIVRSPIRAKLKQFPADLNRWDSQQARNEGVFAH